MAHYAVIPVKFTGEYIARMCQTVRVDLLDRSEQVSLLLEGNGIWRLAKGKVVGIKFKTGDNHFTIVPPNVETAKKLTKVFENE